MPLRVYNTLTRQKEDFQTVAPGKVSMYLCGPTVYKPAHIGHMVGPVIFDTVKRYLTYSGYEVTWVINITDVDDKLINKATEKGVTVEALAKEMTQDYFDNLHTMGVDSVDHFPYATQHIAEMQEMIGQLIEKGHAYPLSGDVYFDVTKDDDYGKLSRRNVEEMLAGTRVEANDRKRHPADFALWKGSKPGEPAWESAWGPGRPGWHIECSAMSRKILGDSIDIHGGGLDLMFPHHENELAQSESCTGQPFARYWMHNGLMQASGASKVGGGHSRHGDTIDQAEQEANKLAGSKGAASVKLLFEKHHPETVRFFLLNTHYRSPIDFGDERIAEVGKGLETFYRLIEMYERDTGQDFYSLNVPRSRGESKFLTDDPWALSSRVNECEQRFHDAMDDDFNTGAAIGVLFELRRGIAYHFDVNSKQRQFENNRPLHDEEIKARTAAMTKLKQFGNLLGLFRQRIEKPAAGGNDEFASQLMELLIQIRAEARKTKQFGIADRIRDGMTALKVTLEDRPEGTQWRRE